MKTIYVIPKAKVIDAIDRLIAHYEGREVLGPFQCCPLCEAANRATNDPDVFCSGSRACPWYWFTGKGCICDYDSGDLRYDRPAWWCRKRLRELREWRRRIIAGEWGRKSGGRK